MSSLSDFRSVRNRRSGEEFEAPDEGFQAKYPALYEWMARTVLKGSPRGVASLTIKYRDGGVNLCLSAPAEGVVGFHQADTVLDGLDALERRLEDGKMEWRDKQDRQRRY